MNYASLYNYYENLVFNYISRELVNQYEDSDEEFFLDVACYSLTRLPARYIRHEIDMVYYLAPGEQEEMEKRVRQTVDSAAKFISDRVGEQTNR
jgi:hypothetical protein